VPSNSVPISPFYLLVHMEQYYVSSPSLGYSFIVKKKKNAPRWNKCCHAFNKATTYQNLATHQFVYVIVCDDDGNDDV